MGSSCTCVRPAAARTGREGRRSPSGRAGRRSRTAVGRARRRGRAAPCGSMQRAPIGREQVDGSPSPRCEDRVGEVDGRCHRSAPVRVGAGYTARARARRAAHVSSSETVTRRQVGRRDRDVATRRGGRAAVMRAARCERTVRERGRAPSGEGLPQAASSVVNGATAVSTPASAGLIGGSGRRARDAAEQRRQLETVEAEVRRERRGRARGRRRGRRSAAAARAARRTGAGTMR